MHEASTEVGLRRPALRRPKIENVEAAEAAKEAAIKAGTAVSITKIKNARNSSSPTILSDSEESSHNDIKEIDSEDNLPRSSSSGSLNAESGNDFAGLICSSKRTEEINEQEKKKQQRREKRCPDYPGLAFGAPLGFGSDTMMKFNIIKNELHNIMRSQLKRVEGEQLALATRIKEFDTNLEKSEQLIKSSTIALAETVELEMERKRLKRENNEEDSDCDESHPLSQFDAQMALLEGKLMQAKALASHKDNIATQIEKANDVSKDSSPVPHVTEKKEEDQIKEDSSIVNAAQKKSNGESHSSTTSLLLNGEHNELIETDSCHKLSHKTDQETSW